jgi:hypothetical protein
MLPVFYRGTLVLLGQRVQFADDASGLPPTLTDPVPAAPPWLCLESVHAA